MKPKPILFNTDMVRGLLAGTKTVTRRLCRITVNGDMTVTHKLCCMARFPAKDKDGLCAQFFNKKDFYKGSSKPPYRPGDILYVQETWCDNIDYELYPWEQEKYWHKADEPDKKLTLLPEWFRGWHPSIHMPREAARIFLRVKNVRVERLQDSFFKSVKCLEVCQDCGKTFVAGPNAFFCPKCRKKMKAAKLKESEEIT